MQPRNTAKSGNPFDRDCQHRKMAHLAKERALGLNHGTAVHFAAALVHHLRQLAPWRRLQEGVLPSTTSCIIVAVTWQLLRIRV